MSPIIQPLPLNSKLALTVFHLQQLHIMFYTLSCTKLKSTSWRVCQHPVFHTSPSISFSFSDIYTLAQTTGSLYPDGIIVLNYWHVHMRWQKQCVCTFCCQSLCPSRKLVFSYWHIHIASAGTQCTYLTQVPALRQGNNENSLNVSFEIPQTLKFSFKIPQILKLFHSRKHRRPFSFKIPQTRFQSRKHRPHFHSRSHRLDFNQESTESISERKAQTRILLASPTKFDKECITGCIFQQSWNNCWQCWFLFFSGVGNCDEELNILLILQHCACYGYGCYVWLP